MARLHNGQGMMQQCSSNTLQEQTQCMRQSVYVLQSAGYAQSSASVLICLHIMLEGLSTACILCICSDHRATVTRIRTEQMLIALCSLTAYCMSPFLGLITFGDFATCHAVSCMQSRSPSTLCLPWSDMMTHSILSHSTFLTHAW